MSGPLAGLEQPNPFADPDLAAYARRLLNLLPGAKQNSATTKTRSAVLLMIDDGEVAIDRAAQCLGVTVRSLQRRLAAEGTSFRQICTDIRRGLAIRYLGNSSVSITEIGALLGYCSSRAFSSWFRAEFGMSAGAYRRMSAVRPANGH